MKIEISTQHLRGEGRTFVSRDAERQPDTAVEENSRPQPMNLMEEVLQRDNLFLALERVTKNKGAPGADMMSVEELPDYLRKEWPRIREELRDGRYQPGGVRIVEIPKPKGGVRTISIPNVLDRLIQQAIAQILNPIFDPDFSEQSYGFRPGRSAHQAILLAREFMAEGYRWVVDIDLEKFFDRINHDILMSRIARKVKDKELLRLIRRYLEAGVMVGGLVSQRVMGAPQGGPLSPLLSNIMLDDLDKELERRGHRFCRYADDCNIYVGSQKAGERVLASVTRFLESRLKLKVNTEKSAVARPWKRKFLGYTVTVNKRPKLKPAPESMKRLRYRIKEITRRGRGKSITTTAAEISRYLKGWASYYKLCDVKKVFMETDQWIRHRLRTIVWRQWKYPKTRYKKMVQCGVEPERAKLAAATGRGPWWNGSASHMHSAFKNRRLREAGLISLSDQIQRLKPQA